MDRRQKETMISELKDMFSRSQAAFLVCYKGLTVAQLQEFRKKLREQDAVLKVAKARLMKIAAAEIEGSQDLSKSFKEQIGLVFAMKEAPSAAKEIVNFAKENEGLGIVAGLFESRMISKDQVSILASIPSREVLLSQLARALQAPVYGLASSLNMTVVKLLYSLQEVAKKKESNS